MSRYDAMFARLRRENAGAFGAFVMLGDPDLETSATILDALAAGGADMIEVGIPFSDPVADGPVIQAAAQRALARGVTPADCFDLITGFRARHPDVPVGILTYANIATARGVDAFYAACTKAGVDSVLLADVPALEAGPFTDAARAHDIAPVLIAAPNTPRATIARIAGLGGGYTYCVARAGVTGAGTEMRLEHDAVFTALSEERAPPPVLGFGISEPAHVRAALAAGAAGVISGSAIVGRIAEAAEPVETVRAFVAGMKAATRLR
ncbi:tryptophan synthase subunit alpha [Allosphingosinicella indica]|uniref:Tryptophan synthase alpha chain n=1 Tax=Allosphingosinicella indica TaxID=941907 RepID=A0A1X7G6B6_9SPHN|nr:tryptophan synthase subunit alpha [Allosphingosinicella indica]SMF64854.1 tryptophan synthase, alpha chain [Allosphingosinicella indica]